MVRKPVRFIRSWLGEVLLPNGICSDGGVFGCDSVVRHFLWNKSFGGDSKLAISEVGLCGGSFDENTCCKHLEKLADVSIHLFWKGIMECQRRCSMQIESLLTLFFNSRFGLGKKAKNQVINYRLESLAKLALSVMEIDEESLDEEYHKEDYLKDLVFYCIKSLIKPGSIQWIKEDLNCLHQLGETISGRKYLSARIAKYSLDPNYD